MMSDVPVGVFLSGGVDSSTNVALMSRLVEHPINTFSIGFRDAEQHNEFQWARQVAERFGTAHHEVQIDSEDLWRFLPDLVHHQDEPIADPVCVPLYFVAKLAKEHGVTVVHVGEGADETLADTRPTCRRTRWRLVTGGAFARCRDRCRRSRARRRGRPRRAPGIPHPSRGAAARRSARRAAVVGRGRGLLRGWAAACHQRGLPGQAATASPLAKSWRDRQRRCSRPARATSRPLIYQDLRLRLPELLLMRVDKLHDGQRGRGQGAIPRPRVGGARDGDAGGARRRDGVGKHVLKRAVGDLLP